MLIYLVDNNVTGAGAVPEPDSQPELTLAPVCFTLRYEQEPHKFFPGAGVTQK
jgi:hypothetical protein